MGVLNIGLMEKVVDQPVFNGDLYRTKCDTLDTFFLSNKDNFSESGIQSFFKACKIPSPNFFLEKPEEYIKETFINQKSLIRERGDILLLVRGNSIVYSAPDIGILQENPNEKFNLENWKFVGEDIKGFHRYVYMPKTYDVNDFFATAYMNIPILYTGNIILELGMYRVLCSNGLVSKVDETQLIKIKTDIYTEPVLIEPLLSSIEIGLDDTQDAYNDFLEYLKAKELPNDSTRIKDFIQILKDDKVIPNNVSVFSMRHIDALDKGDNISDVTIPDSATTYYDLTNILTRFGQECNTLSAQNKVETKVYEYMYEQYNREKQSSISTLNLQELYDRIKNVEESEELQQELVTEI